MAATNPARLGLVEPSLAGSPLLGLVEPSLAGFPRTQLLGLTRQSWVLMNPALLFRC
ncbi:hypothetical protein SLEP1_g19011 [Rubroshorea leprosula]|nr:hypothetical protein SLEP1_g19011 [Rubroshorea leprosula]